MTSTFSDVWCYTLANPICQYECGVSSPSSAASTCTPPSCRYQWRPESSSFYRLFEETSFQDQILTCEAEGAHPAYFRSAAEHAVLEHYVGRRDHSSHLTVVASLR